MTPLERAAQVIRITLHLATAAERAAADRAARAVLSAIREPSEGMVEAGGENMDHEGATLPDELEERAMAVWQAMIDHMLAEERPYSIVGERIDFVFREDGTLAESE